MTSPGSHCSDKHLLLVGGGDDEDLHNYWYTEVKESGIKISVADKPNHWSRELLAKGLIHSFHPVNLDLSTGKLADEIVQLVSNSEVDFSGVVTFKDRYLVPVAEAAQKLNLPTNGPEAYRNAQNKQKARIICNSPVHHFHIKGVDDLPEAAKTVGFPAVLKPVPGTDSLGVRYVVSFDDLEKTYLEIDSKLPEISAFVGEIPAMLLEQYISGPEHIVDLIIEDGEVLFASLCDCQSGELPWFQKLGDCYPSELDSSDQRKLINYAAEVCEKLKMTNGVMHVKLKLCESRPQLIELNARMGGVYVWHAVKTVWSVDLLLSAYRAALGLPMLPPNRGALDLSSCPPKAYAVTRYLCSPFTGYVLNTDYLLPFLNDERVLYVHPAIKVGGKAFGARDSRPSFLALLLFTGSESVKDTKKYVEEVLKDVSLSKILSKQPLQL